MENRKRNVTALGLLVLAAGAIFIWGFYYMLGTPVLGGGTRIYVALQNGAGLKRGDRVFLQGVDVGSVAAVELNAPGSVSAELRLETPLKLPADTRAAVRGDVFGAHTVDLAPGSALVKLQSGDTIRGLAAAALPEMAADLGDRARAVLAGADSLLSPDAVRNLHATAQVLPASAVEMRDAFVELHRAAAALRRSAEGVEGAKTGPALTSALGEVERSARAMTAAAGTMDRSLNSLASVLQKVDNGTGTLGRLVNDSSLYRDLSQAAREVAGLAADVKQRPGRYVSIKVF